MQLSSGKLVNNANSVYKLLVGILCHINVYVEHTLYLHAWASIKCVLHNLEMQHTQSKTNGMHEYGDPNLTAVRKVLCNN